MRSVYPATLLVSAGAIGYELLLMRVLSIVQWHHFAYMIISLALLGYGASGTLIALNRHRLEQRFELAFALSALLCSITMVLCFILGQRVPFNALEIVWNPRQLLYLSLLYLLFMVPFLFAASCIGLAFTCRRFAISRIYFFDLLGAGFGALSLIGALFVLAPQHALILFMALPLMASFVMTRRASARTPLVAAQLAWLALFLTGVPQSQLDLRISEYKGLSQALEVVDSRILHASSSPLGLISVVESRTVPVRHAPGLSFNTRHIPPAQLQVFTDADSMSAITRFTGDPRSIAYLGDVTAALPYALLDEPKVLVLGAGGGGDVLLALFHNAAAVDAVELNPGMSELVADTYAAFAGHIYADKRVRLFTQEARGFVAQSRDAYDIIHIGLLDSFGASGAGVQALNENYLYTVEAVREYLAHTAPGGMIAITRWLKLPPRDSLKLVATAREALLAEGVGEPEAHLAMIRSWNTSTLLIRREAFTAGDSAAIRSFSQARSFDLISLPGMRKDEANRFNRLAEPYFFEGTTALLGDDAEDYTARYKFHIEPATDNRPYYFHFFKWRTLPEVFALRQAGGAGLIEWGYLILVATLLQAAVAGLFLILLPLLRARRGWPRGTGLRMGSYFLLLGLAFLFIEMAFIQKFILFLSHPLYSVAVVLSSFLVFAGIGSAWSDSAAAMLRARGHEPVLVVAGCIAVLAIMYLVVLPIAFDRFIGSPDFLKIVLTNVFIAPLAFTMGMPFPLGLTRVTDRAPQFIPWAWGINGFASVVSAVLATLLAVRFGFNIVIVLALVLYGAAALLMSKGVSARA